MKKINWREIFGLCCGVVILINASLGYVLECQDSVTAIPYPFEYDSATVGGVHVYNRALFMAGDTVWSVKYDDTNTDWSVLSYDNASDFISTSRIISIADTTDSFQVSSDKHYWQIITITAPDSYFVYRDDTTDTPLKSVNDQLWYYDNNFDLLWIKTFGTFVFELHNIDTTNYK